MKLGSTQINKVYLGATEAKKVYLGTNLIYDNSSIDTVVTIDTTSTSSTWTPTSIINSGATLTWEVTGDVTPIAPQVIDKPILNLSSNTGTANITITSSTGFVGFTELWLNNGTTSLEVISIDPSEATALTKIDLFTNDLTTIDLSSNTALIYPWIQSNALTTIDLSSNTLATFIAVDNNSLTALDISANVLLTDLWANDNALTTAELDAIINDLDTNGLSNGEVRLAGNTGLPLTAASGTAYDALVGKGWTIDVAKYTPADTTDPVIGTLAYANETDTTVELSATATDNIAVVSFDIYLESIFDRNVLGTSLSSYEFDGLTASTNYDIFVVAKDAADNESLASNIINFTTDATPTPPATDDLRPVISNFRVLDSQKGRVYFDSSEIITASTGVNGYTGFTITDKVISQITINTGLLVDHYFDVTVDFNHYSNNTIRYEGGSDLADSDSNNLYNFLITDISNNIVEPETSTNKYVEVGGSGDGSIGSPWGFEQAGSNVSAGETVWVKAGNYGNINVTIATTGTLANPIKFIGYTTSITDPAPSLTREIDLAFDSAVMPLLVGNGTDSGIYADYKEYIFIKNIQVENYLNNININHSSYVVCDNIYSKDADNPLRMVLSPSFGMRVLNSYVADATSHGMWMYGAHHRVDNCWVVSSRVLHMDYHISYNAGSAENGYNIIKDCYIHSYWDDSHGDHGISIKGEPSNLSEYTLIENCTLENNGQGIEFRHENSKRNVVRNCYATRTPDKITASRNKAALVTFRDGCTHNTVIDCTMDTLSYGVYFNDQPLEEGDQAGGHYNKVINSIFENNDSDITISDGIDTSSALEPTNNEFLNCTFYGSNKLISNNLVSFGLTNKITNCIVELVPSYDGNPTFAYSNFYTSFPTPSGVGNISVKPNFTDIDGGDFSLSSITHVDIYEGGTDTGVYYDKDGRESLTPFSQGAYKKNSTDIYPDYYVSASGNDSNDGSTEFLAWKTLNYAKQQTYQAGDIIGYKRGEVWEENYWYSSHSSGTDGNNIVLTAYGSGAKPIFNSHRVQTGLVWTDTGGNIWTTPAITGRRLFKNGVELLLAFDLAEVGTQGTEYYHGSSTLYVYSTTDPSSDEFAWSENISENTRLDNANYITFDNLDIRGGDSRSLSINANTNGWQVTNCHIGWNSSSGFKTEGVADDILVDNCTFDANFTVDMSQIAAGGTGVDGRGCNDGLALYGAVTNLECKNSFFKNWGHSAIETEPQTIGSACSNISFHDNEVTTPDILWGRAVAWTGYISNSEFYNNYIHDISVQNQIGGQDNHYYNNIIDGVLDSPLKASAIGVGFKLGNTTYNSNGNIVENNVILNTQSQGLLISDYGDDIFDNIIRNNIVYNCGLTKSNIGIEPNEDVPNNIQNNLFQNNLIYNSATALTCRWKYTGSITNVATFNSASSDVSNNIDGDPLFVDNSGNWRLQNGSPAINTGISSLSTIDYFGNTRPYLATNIDIGINETDQ